MSNLVTFAVPAAYKYVLLTATISTFIPSWPTNQVIRFRKAAQVPYPQASAPPSEAAPGSDKYRFNCAQRAHANFTENHASFLACLLIAGLKYPTWAAGLGASWILARVLYWVGYTRKDDAEGGKGRHLGSWWALPHVALLVLAVFSSLKIF